MLSKEEIDIRFTYHPPKDGQAQTYEFIRNRAKQMATDLCCDCPASPELVEALTKLEECVMWANAAVARRG